MWIQRDLEARLGRVAGQFPALALTGARQTGKTSLLRHLFPKAAFVPLDLPSNAEAAEQTPERFLADFPEPVILDEVQYAPGLFRFLKVRIDQDRHQMGRFLMSGSQKFPLMKALSESLAGRSGILELETLSAKEALGVLALADHSLAELIWRGGFPELYRNPGMDVREFYSAYVATYLERDVRFAVRVGSLRDFQRFLRACAFRSAQLLNLADLARDVGISQGTAREWLSVLDASSQITLLEPYYVNLGKRLVQTPKLYFRDTGLLCFLLGLDSAAAAAQSAFAGPLWETFVFGQIQRARGVLAPAAGVFFWRDAHGVEVDFVLEHQGRLRLVEAKWSETAGAEARNLAALKKVAQLAGSRAASEHWVACLAPRSYLVQRDPPVRLVNGFRFSDWFPASV